MGVSSFLPREVAVKALAGLRSLTRRLAGPGPVSKLTPRAVRSPWSFPRGLLLRVTLRHGPWLPQTEQPWRGEQEEPRRRSKASYNEVLGVMPVTSAAFHLLEASC